MLSESEILDDEDTDLRVAYAGIPSAVVRYIA